MIRTKRTRRAWGRPLVAICVAFMVVVIAAVAVFAMGRLLEDNTTHGGQLPADDIAHNDDQLRGKPSFEATAEQLDVMLVDASDALTATFPYLQFQWTRESSSISCAGTSAYAKLSAIRAADVPVAEGDWERALQIVVDHAAPLGPVETGRYHDEPGNRDTEISAGGFTIRFGYDKATVLSGHSPCRLPRNVLDEQ